VAYIPQCILDHNDGILSPPRPFGLILDLLLFYQGKSAGRRCLAVGRYALYVCCAAHVGRPTAAPDVPPLDPDGWC
jgi:hypothetical protein